MNALDRSLIEKAGYDNGFEIVQKSDLSVVSLCSSLHPVKVDITIGSHEGAYDLQFSDTLSLPELKRGLNGGLHSFHHIFWCTRQVYPPLRQQF